MKWPFSYTCRVWLKQNEYRQKQVKQVCIQLPMSADNVALPAVLQHGCCWMLDSNRSVSPARQAYSSKPAAVECGRRIEQTNTISLHTMQAVPIKRYTHTRLTALYLGLPRSAGTRKVKPMWILLKQETVSGNGISWAICKSAPSSRQITTPAPHHSVFYRPDSLPATQPTASKHWRHW